MWEYMYNEKHVNVIIKVPYQLLHCSGLLEDEIEVGY